MKQNANDGIGSATAAPFRTPATLFTQTTRRERGNSGPPGADASASPTEISALLALALLLLAAGIVTGIFTIAFAQLLLAVRDMAINSFHIRHALPATSPVP